MILFTVTKNIVLDPGDKGKISMGTDQRSTNITILIQHGKNGMLVDVANTQELSDAMRQMLAQPELRRSCGQNALEINERLQLDGIIRQWQDCFEM